MKAFGRDVDADVNVIREVEDNMWLRVPLNTQPGDSQGRGETTYAVDVVRFSDEVICKRLCKAMFGFQAKTRWYATA